MQYDEIRGLAAKEHRWSTVRHIGVWGMVLFSVFVMVKASPDPVVDGLGRFTAFFSRFEYGNTVAFTLGAGFLVSMIFTYFLVLNPENRRKRKIKKCLLHVVCYILEAKKENVCGWCKNVALSDIKLKSSRNIKELQSEVQEKRVSLLAVNLYLQHFSEALHLFESALPAAMAVSSAHGLCWIGMTSSTKKLNDVYNHQLDESVSNESINEDFYTNFGEFLLLLDQFVNLDD
ncbi:hypothetical protein ACI3L3_11075 [Desulfobaculum sp. SPO524]|uniref:hypothetical protein n=1 Tax=Desulfobaculum sp. SPO524 TaxID=3378071 RepID=UPI0038546746